MQIEKFTGNYEIRYACFDSGLVGSVMNRDGIHYRKKIMFGALSMVEFTGQDL